MRVSRSVCRNVSFGHGLHQPTTGAGLLKGPGACPWFPEQAAGVCGVGRCWGVWGGGGMHHEHSMPCYCTQVFAGFMCDQVKVLMRTILLYSNAETPNIPKVLHSSVSLPSVPTSLLCVPTQCANLTPLCANLTPLCPYPVCQPHSSVCQPHSSVCQPHSSVCQPHSSVSLPSVPTSLHALPTC